MPRPRPTAPCDPQLTDWLDGYLARRMGLQSVLGSYLDPLGDKVLVCCVMGALAWKGLVPAWVAWVVLGRDGLLVAGTVLHRWRTLGWRWASAADLFDVTKGGPKPATGDGVAAGAGDAEAAAPAPAAGGSGPGGQAAGATAAAPGGAHAAGTAMPFMRPLVVSKVNTVLQLALVSGCLTHAWVQWPPAEAMAALEAATAATTVASGALYVHKYATGKLF